MATTYRDAGVDIDEGDRLVDLIKPLARPTLRPEVLAGIGGFGGLFALDVKKYRDPVLVSGTDGVGTKLKLAFLTGRHDTVGIDLVAMSVNDVAVTGAEPLFFLDYFATGKLRAEEAAQVVKGIAEGCRQAGCALIGGETAELPGFYADGEYDLAGFAVGVVERDRILDGRTVRPRRRAARRGLHRAALERLLAGAQGAARAPRPLRPAARARGPRPSARRSSSPPASTRKDILALLEQVPVHAVAHITGGGLPGQRAPQPARRDPRGDPRRELDRPRHLRPHRAGGRGPPRRDVPDLQHGAGARRSRFPPPRAEAARAVLAAPRPRELGGGHRRAGHRRGHLRGGRVIRIGVLASGSGSNLQALLDAARDGRIDGTVAAVVCNVPGARALERARVAGVPTELLPSKGVADREAYDREVVARLLGPPGRPGLPGRLDAPRHPGLPRGLRALAGEPRLPPRDERAPGAPPQLPGPPRAAAGDRLRASASPAARSTSWTPAPTPARSSSRPPSRCCPATTRPPSRPASSSRSTASTRSRCSGSPRGGSTVSGRRVSLRDAAAPMMDGVANPSRDR